MKHDTSMPFPTERILITEFFDLTVFGNRCEEVLSPKEILLTRGRKINILLLTESQHEALR